MASYHINDGELSVPEGWQDKSVVALSFPAGAAKPDASFAITRDPNAGNDGKTLASYVDRQLVDMAKNCPRFELVAREATQVDSSAAERIRFVWRSPDGSAIEQQQTILMLSGQIALTFTATAARAKFEQYAPAFSALVGSFRLRRSVA